MARAVQRVSGCESSFAHRANGIGRNRGAAAFSATDQRSERHLSAQLAAWADADGTGIGFGVDSGYDLPNGANRGPDASWVLRSRIEPLPDGERFLKLSPDFAVELCGPSDDLGAVQGKCVEYIDNGTRLAWLIDPQHRRVYVYRPGVEEQVLENPAMVTGDPELPGFRLDLTRIWDPGF